VPVLWLNNLEDKRLRRDDARILSDNMVSRRVQQAVKSRSRFLQNSSLQKLMLATPAA
jgi:hypothetical protein